MEARCGALEGSGKQWQLEGAALGQLLREPAELFQVECCIGQCPGCLEPQGGLPVGIELGKQQAEGMIVKFTPVTGNRGKR